jgi:hypothetical protein
MRVGNNPGSMIVPHPPSGSLRAGDSARRARLARRGPTSRRVWLAALLGLVLTACTSQPTPPTVTPEQFDAPRLVLVVVQTERTIQIRHADEVIEVARATGWPRLQPPVLVCVTFDQPRETRATRVAQLTERSRCPTQ